MSTKKSVVKTHEDLLNDICYCEYRGEWLYIPGIRSIEDFYAIVDSPQQDELFAKNPRNTEIFFSRYDIRAHGFMTISSLAETYGVSRSSIDQILSKMIRQLRRNFHINNLCKSPLTPITDKAVVQQIVEETTDLPALIEILDCVSDKKYPPRPYEYITIPGYSRYGCIHNYSRYGQSDIIVIQSFDNFKRGDIAERVSIYNRFKVLSDDGEWHNKTLSELGDLAYSQPKYRKHKGTLNVYDKERQY